MYMPLLIQLPMVQLQLFSQALLTMVQLQLLSQALLTMVQLQLLSQILTVTIRILILLTIPGICIFLLIIPIKIKSKLFHLLIGRTRYPCEKMNETNVDVVAGLFWPDNANPIRAF